MSVTYQDIIALAQQGESETLEFKKSTTQLKSAAESLCGFLNHKGGIVLMGVLNSGEIVGQQVSDATQKEIANTLQKFEPHPRIEVNYISIPHCHNKIIALRASPDLNQKPYSLEGRAFFRQQSSTVVMPQSQYQEILLQRHHQPIAWDKFSATDYTLADLDQARILSIFQQGIRKERIPSQFSTQDPAQALERLQLLHQGKLTNAAVVLFCNDPMPMYAQCLVKLAVFRDHTKRFFIDSKHVHGNLFDLYEQAEEFLRRHTSVGSYFISGQVQRVDVPDYPPLAVRETLINALAHRDYAQPGGSITVALYPDLLEISSCGRLDPHLTIDLLRQPHPSYPRNHLIANVLYRCGYIESYGSGTEEIVRFCEESAGSGPQFEERGGFFVVKLPKAHLPEPVSLPPTVGTTPVTERQKHILDLLAQHQALSNRLILEYLGQDITDRMLRKDLTALKSRGLIDKKGQSRSTLWFLKSNSGTDCGTNEFRNQFRNQFRKEGKTK